jgi:hypothetical protein
MQATAPLHAAASTPLAPTPHTLVTTRSLTQDRRNFFSRGNQVCFAARAAAHRCSTPRPSLSHLETDGQHSTATEAGWPTGRGPRTEAAPCALLVAPRSSAPTAAATSATFSLPGLRDHTHVRALAGTSISGWLKQSQHHRKRPTTPSAFFPARHSLIFGTCLIVSYHRVCEI